MEFRSSLFRSFGGDPNIRVRAALAPCNGIDAWLIFRQNRQYIALMQFIAPDLGGGQAGLFQMDLLQFEQSAPPRVVDQFRKCIGQAARAHVVDGNNGVVFALLPATVDNFLAWSLDFMIAALHRIEIQFGAVLAHAPTADPPPPPPTPEQ